MQDSLTIHWPYLGLALLTLWFPRQWMRIGRLFRKHRKQRELFDKFAQDGGRDPDDKSVKLGRELANKRNYLDLFRALAGGYALWHFSFEVHDADGALFRIWLAAVVALAGVLVQALRLGERVTFFAPVFYFTGLSIALGDPYAGGFAFLLTCAINPVIPNPRMFTTAYGLLLLPFNLLFGAGVVLTLLNSFLVLIVPLISLLVGRSMVIFTRRAE